MLNIEHLTLKIAAFKEDKKKTNFTLKPIEPHFYVVCLQPTSVVFVFLIVCHSCVHLALSYIYHSFINKTWLIY